MAIRRNNLELGTIMKLFSCLTLLIYLLPSCLEDDITTESSVVLNFSTDTLRFDTVFTTIGSSTRSFRIRNIEAQDVIVTSVSLEEGPRSKFRLNVDGIASNEVHELRIPANDSIWVFAEVTIDPDQPLSISPFVIQEGVLVSVNGNIQRMVLEAWGQNANYITSRDSAGGVSFISCDLGILNWDDPKPYIIYGLAIIDNCRLKIAPGTQIHIHGGITNDGGTFRNDGFLIISPSSSIQATGSFGNPIIFQGDRLETEFSEVSGQWGGILIDAASRDNLLDFVEIKNSIIGIRTDSLTQLNIKNTKIFNTAGSGILSRASIVNISNSLLYNNGISAWEIAFGGNYSAKHTTFANYLNNDPAIFLSNAICRERNDLGQCTSVDVRPLQIVFTNSVIAGNEDDEISLFDNTENEDDFDIQFMYSAIQADQNADDLALFVSIMANCDQCQILNIRDTVFRNEDQLDFHPDSVSVLNNRALFDNTYVFDLDGIMRTLDSTDIGCFEFVPQ